MRARLPPATLALVAAVVLTRIAQLAVPGWYDALARHPDAPWWRVFTALFAYDDGWPQFLGIAIGIVVLGLLAERHVGTGRWLAIFLVSGLVGQAFGLVWQPEGAGSSVAVAGLLGATAALFAFGGALPTFARIGPVAVLAGGFALAAMQDLHGPPMLIGFAFGALAVLHRPVLAPPH